MKFYGGVDEGDWMMIDVLQLVLVVLLVELENLQVVFVVVQVGVDCICQLSKVGVGCVFYFNSDSLFGNMDFGVYVVVMVFKVLVEC